LYAVPARQSEWYVKHMYGNRGVAAWHAEKFGPQDKFGYKDFIPLFTCERFNADEWAELFEKSGATYVVPTAEHHDGFALWDSALTKFDAKDMGPKRDLIGELAVAVRKRGLKFGVSNHRMEHFNFISPLPGLKTDLLDPDWAEFYSVADRSDAARQRFLDDWVARNFELIDKYHPDMLWFDNGVNSRSLDPLKLKVAAYYYNRAREWGKQVSLSTKDAAYLAGSIKDFERQGRGPKELTDYVWQVDDSVHQRWGYLEDAQYTSVGSIISRLVDNVSRNGNLMMNFSPKADGTIPPEQQRLLLGTGEWLKINGEAIFKTRPWVKDGEGSGNQTYRFTTRGNVLYAIAKQWPGQEAVISSLGSDNLKGAKIEAVSLLGHSQPLEFVQDKESLKVKLPAEKPCEHAYALKITGLTLK
jgi:alpha-L-fucosidase